MSVVMVARPLQGARGLKQRQRKARFARHDVARPLQGARGLKHFTGSVALSRPWSRALYRVRVD